MSSSPGYAEHIAGYLSPHSTPGSFVHFNPAGLDCTTGTEVCQGLNYIPILEIKAKFTQGTETPPVKRALRPWFNNGIDPEVAMGITPQPLMALPFVNVLPILLAPYNGIAHHEKDSPFAFGFALVAPYAGGWRHNTATTHTASSAMYPLYAWYWRPASPTG